MIPYLILFFSTFLFPTIKKIRIIKGLKITGLKAVFLMVFIFSALRFDVGYDYSMYYAIIEGNIRWFDAQIQLEIMRVMHGRKLQR